jgi:uncharacterized membrane protein YciS (DUF1049 family)
METALAILLALGIFVGIPAVIGFGIVGAVVLRQRVRMARAARAARAVPEVPTATAAAGARE